MARAIDRAVAALDARNRLSLELRGHVGGGLGVLRLTAGKLRIVTLCPQSYRARIRENEPAETGPTANTPAESACDRSITIRFVNCDSSIALLLGSLR